jgi:hypothetical protein
MLVLLVLLQKLWYNAIIIKKEGSQMRKIAVLLALVMSVGCIESAPMQESPQITEAVNQIMIVHEVDSSIRIPHFQQQGEEFPEEAFTGRIAVAYNSEFVTEFDFINYNRGGGQTLVTLIKDGKHGIIDKNGDVIIDFIFDEIIIIDDSTAFAKHDGKYGIISIR